MRAYTLGDRDEWSGGGGSVWGGRCAADVELVRWRGLKSESQTRLPMASL